MILESLANELLLDLFSYLDTNDLFHAFYNLNTRFKQLLFVHCQLSGYLNLQLISQTTFRIICQDYLPHILAQISSIHLSDDDETPGQIDVFLSYGFQLSHLTHLKFLTLTYISSESILTAMITSLHQLVHLTHLKIRQCSIDHNSLNNNRLFDQLWSLNNLTHFDFQRHKQLWKPFFIAPNVSSSSIRSLYLEGFSYNSQQLHHLLAHTNNLIDLKIDVDYNYDHEQISLEMYRIERLKIFVQFSSSVTSHLLRRMANLTDLTIELANVFMDGDQWKEIIHNHLSCLKKFRMKMEFILRGNHQDRQGQIGRLVDSFRDPFWIYQHRWYVQCHWYASNKSSKAYLYTIPYYSKELVLLGDLQMKSTCPNEKISWCFDNVEDLVVKSSTCSLIRFSYLKHLKVTFPLDDCFYSSVWNVRQVKSLNVFLAKDVNSSIHLHNLVQQATILYSLTLTGEMLSKEILYDLQNSSIRRLDLCDIGCFDGEDCDKLTCCYLGIQCEVLWITVKDRRSILTLINEMANMRVLNVRLQDDQWRRDSEQLLRRDELIQWLKESLLLLSSSCIVRRECMPSISHVQIWIR